MCVVSKCVIRPTTQSGVKNSHPTIVQPGNNAAIGVYDGGNSGIGAANHRHARLNGAYPCLQKMLVGTGCITKPAVIRHI